MTGHIAIGTVLLFSPPKVDPLPAVRAIPEDFEHLSAEGASDLHHIRLQRQANHAGILARAALVAQTFGMPELARMDVHDASEALLKLTKHRSDVSVLLSAYWSKSAADSPDVRKRVSA